MSEKVLSVVYQTTAKGTTEAAAQIEAMDAKIQASAKRTAEVQGAYNRQTISQIRSLSPQELAIAQSMGMNVGLPSAAAKDAEQIAGREILTKEARGAVGKIPGIGGGLGMLGAGAMGPGAMLAMGGVAAIGGLSAVADDLLQRYRAESRSLQDLRQATEVAHLNFSQVNSSVERFLDTNSKYITNVNDAREGFAELTRSGLNQSQVMKGMNDAIDLSAAKHIDLSQAVQLVDLAEQGNARGLRDLGINVKDYTNLTASAVQVEMKLPAIRQASIDADIRLNDAHMKLKDTVEKYGSSSEQAKKAQEAVTVAAGKDALAHTNLKLATDAVTTKSHAQAAVLDDLHTKTAGARDNMDKLQQATNTYNRDMDKLAHEVGPALLGVMSALVSGMGLLAENVQGIAEWMGHVSKSGNPGGSSANWQGIGGSWSDRSRGRSMPSGPFSTGHSSGGPSGHFGL